jgi:hypothetical protein
MRPPAATCVKHDGMQTSKCHPKGMLRCLAQLFRRLPSPVDICKHLCAPSYPPQDEFNPRGGIIITENGAAIPEDGVDDAVKDVERAVYLKRYLTGGLLATVFWEGKHALGHFPERSACVFVKAIPVRRAASPPRAVHMAAERRAAPQPHARRVLPGSAQSVIHSRTRATQTASCLHDRLVAHATQCPQTTRRPKTAAQRCTRLF